LLKKANALVFGSEKVSALILGSEKSMPWFFGLAWGFSPTKDL
jgi:hypothetical protein